MRRHEPLSLAVRLLCSARPFGVFIRSFLGVLLTKSFFVSAPFLCCCSCGAAVARATKAFEGEVFSFGLRRTSSARRHRITTKEQRAVGFGLGRSDANELRAAEQNKRVEPNERTGQPTPFGAEAECAAALRSHHLTDTPVRARARVDSGMHRRTATARATRTRALPLASAPKRTPFGRSDCSTSAAATTG